MRCMNRAVWLILSTRARANEIQWRLQCRWDVCCMDGDFSSKIDRGQRHSKCGERNPPAPQTWNGTKRCLKTMTGENGCVRNSKELTIDKSPWEHCAISFLTTPAINQKRTVIWGACLKKIAKSQKHYVLCHFLTCPGCPIFHQELHVALKNKQLYDHGQQSLGTQTA